MRLIGLARRMPIQAVERKIYPFNYESYDVATLSCLKENIVLGQEIFAMLESTLTG